MTAGDGTTNGAPLSEDDWRMVQVLSYEYSALRADILHRSAARYSLLGVFLGVAAIGATVITSSSERINWWLIGLIVFAYVAIVLRASIDAGRSIGRLSNRLVALEDEINDKMGCGRDHPLLVWERKQQKERGWPDTVLMGDRDAITNPR
jgi:hypothetical protein